MKSSKLLSILFIAGTLTLGLTVSQSVFASDGPGPPGGPHHSSDFPPGTPQGDTPGNPHDKLGIAEPPPGYGDPHTGEERKSPQLGEKGNPHQFSALPGHAGSPPSNPGKPTFAESPSNTSHGEDTFTSFPGEHASDNSHGEPTFTSFPGEAFDNVSFGD